MTRLSLSLLMLVLLSTVGLGWAIDRLYGGLVNTPQDGLQIYREFGNNLVSSAGSSEELANIVDAWPSTNSIRLQFIDSAELLLPEELDQQMRSGEPLVLESENDVTLYFALKESSEVLTVSTPPVESRTQLEFALTMLFYSGMILFVLLWIYPLVSRLMALGRTARAFGKGQLDKRVATRERSFLFGIENEFNSMAQRIQSLVADNKILASAVSHDLRTPLARLRFGVDLLEETEDENVRAEYQRRISSDLTTMENLVEVLLEYARLDQQLNELPKTTVDLSEIVTAGVESLNLVEENRITWDEPSEPYAILAHSRYVAMMVNNLLQNAVNYGGDHASITILMKRNVVCLTVEDNGPGIPVEKRDQVLKPFVRGEEQIVGGSRKGYGMGLAIVSRIAQWHDAQFSIGDSERLGGARFDILFPAVNSIAIRELKASPAY